MDFGFKKPPIDTDFQTHANFTPVTVIPTALPAWAHSESGTGPFFQPQA